MAKQKLELREKCRKLRMDSRMSIKEIEKETGAARSSISNWVKDIVLTNEELAERQKIRRRGVKGGIISASSQWWNNRESSKIFKLLGENEVAKNYRGRVAEAAVRLRISALGYDIYLPCFDGNKLDCIVGKANEMRTVRIQVKCMRQGKNGVPLTPILCANGRGKYKRIENDSFDILIGYSSKFDAAFLFKSSELIKHKKSISATQASEEAWHKLEDFFKAT